MVYIIKILIKIQIEVGGQYNYIEEVNNTLKIIAKVIYEYLKENEKEK